MILKTLAVSVAVLCSAAVTALPAAAATSAFWISAPAEGSTLTGTAALVSLEVSDTTWCEGSVRWEVDGVDSHAFASKEGGGGGWDTVAGDYKLDSTLLSNGTHTFVANAYCGGSFEETATPARTFTVRNIAPTVQITTPASGAVVSGPSVKVAADAAPDPGGSQKITKVEFYLGEPTGAADHRPFGSDNLAPYEAAFDSTAHADGQHELYAVAYDSAGLKATSPANQITVANHPDGPFWISSPADGSTLTGTTALVSLEVSGTYCEGSVRWEVDGVDSHAFASKEGGGGGWDTVAGDYKLDSTLLSDGTHTFVANAYCGGSFEETATPARTFTVRNIAPTVQITSPASGAVVSGPSVEVAADATPDAGGTQEITKVEFYLGEPTEASGLSPFASDNLAPYEATFDSTAHADGQHELYAVAYDSAGLVGTSGAMPISIDNGLSSYVSVDPVRILDTRNGTGAPRARVGPGGTIDLRVTGGPRAVPADATAVVLNVTVVAPSAATDIRVYPTQAGGTPPTVSNLNVRAGTTAANLVISKIGENGSVRLRNAGGTVDLLADVAGYYRAGTLGSSFVSLAPTRLLDTRIGTGAPKAAVGPGATLDLALGGSHIPAEASAVVLNVTAVAPTSSTDIRAYPTPVDSAAIPTVSNLNPAKGVTTPNLVIVKIGEDGRVRVRNAAGNVHLLADLAGYYTPDASNARFQPLAPVRLMDTRSTNTGPSTSGDYVDLPMSGTRGVPTDAAAVVLNVTAVNATHATDVRVYPVPSDGSDSFPNVSNLNVRAGVTVPNLVVAKLGPDGRLRFRNSSGSVDLIADLAGYYQN